MAIVACEYLFDPALGANFVVGCVDGSEFVVRDLDKLFRHTLRDQRVRMVLADEFAVGGLNLVIAGIMGDAQNSVGVGQVRSHILFANACKVGICKPEDRRNVAQIGEFVLMDFPIGLGDVEQTIEQFFKHSGVVRKHPGDLSGIGLISGGGFARLIENPRNILSFLGRNLEDPSKSPDFVWRYHTVCLGELRTECDHGYRKTNLLGRIRSTSLGRVLPRLIVQMACANADECAQWPTDREPGRAT